MAKEQIKYEKNKKDLIKLRKEGDKLNVKLDVLCSKISTLEDTIRKYEQKSNSIKLEKSFKEDIKLLRKRIDIERVEVIDGIVKVYTKLITINYEDDNYDIGKFVIEIDNWDVNLTNLNPLGQDGEYMHHPHIDFVVDDSDKDICFGEWKAPIERMKNVSLFKLVVILLKYLKSYNHDDAYIGIERWSG